MSDDEYHLDDFVVADNAAMIDEHIGYHGPEMQQAEWDYVNLYEADSGVAVGDRDIDPTTAAEAGVPNNVSAEQFEELMETFAGLINLHTTNPSLLTAWSAFGNHIARRPQAVRHAITTALQEALVQGINGYCEGWLYSQAEESAFMSRTELHGGLVIYLSNSLSEFVGEWFPDDSEEPQEQVVEWEEYNNDLTLNHDILAHHRSGEDIGGAAALSVLALWKCMLDIFVAGFFEVYIRAL
jgi:hypothetical protein